MLGDFRTESTFDGPMIQAMQHARESQSQFFGPIRGTHGPALERHESCTRAIDRLFLDSRPSTIVRRIALRSITTVYLMLCGWLYTHVAQEPFEDVPGITHRNSNSTIPWIRIVRRIVTAVHHALPTDIFGRVRETMGPANVADNFSLQATATFGVFQSKVGARDDFGVTARTLAHPLSFPTSTIRIGTMKNRQSAKRLTRHIFRTLLRGTFFMQTATTKS